MVVSPGLARKWLLPAVLAVSVAAQAQAIHGFDMPAQALSDSLRELGDQAHLNVIFDPAAVKDRKAPAIKGRYEAKQVLQALLRGSGFVGDFAAADTVVIRALPIPQKQADAGSANGGNKNSTRRKGPLTLKPITVLGSLIPRTQGETTSPIITITSRDLSNKGFRNVYDALHAMPIATGGVQDNQSASQGTFTPGANVISLFGLDPAFTMILVDGNPLADYPLPYNGTESITDLSNIPIIAVDHIDIITGGQSSLYGSSAIAGVVNIILKKNVEGTEMDFRAGGYGNGGGQNERLQLIGGYANERFSAVYAFSLTNQDPIRVSQSFWPSRLSSPLGPPYVAGQDFLFLESGYNPAPSACANVAGLFGGTLGYHQENGVGYCGSYYDSSNTTLLNESLEADGYLHTAFQLNDNAELYTDLLYGFSRQVANTGPAPWVYQNPQLVNSADVYGAFFYDAASGAFASMARLFSPEETGSSDAGAYRITTRQYNTNLGIRGGLGESNWAYDLYYNRSEVGTDTSQRWPLTQPFNDYYLGPQLGTDPYGFGLPAYDPDLANFYKPLTQAQWLAMTGLIHDNSVSWQQGAHLSLTNTDLFNMRGGSAGFAAVAEYGNQAFHSPADPALIAGDFNGRTGFGGAGSRKHWAVGGELRLPLLQSLTADLSARYDSYDYAGRTDSKPTYKLGLEYRPIDTLLLRANYATTFRAPDMYYIFQQPSGFYQAATDFYLCRLKDPDSSNFSNCGIPASGQVFSFYRGSPDLKDVTGKSLGYGAVWSPTANFALRADYTRFAIKNEIVGESIDSLLETEADCKLGKSLSGQAYDINSATCQQALSQVHRYPDDDPFVAVAGQIQNVQTYPVNVADEWLDGIQVDGDYKLDLGRHGNLDFGAEYYVELHHRYRQNADDPYVDELHQYNSLEFKTRGSASISWAIRNWTSTLFGTLYGRGVNYGGTGTLGRWATFNGSVNYDLDRQASVQLTANNLFNRAPPSDASYPGPSSAYPPPYYNVYLYNGYGRAYWLEYKFRF